MQFPVILYAFCQSVTLLGFDCSCYGRRGEEILDLIPDVPCFSLLTAFIIFSYHYHYHYHFSLHHNISSPIILFPFYSLLISDLLTDSKLLPNIERQKPKGSRKMKYLLQHLLLLLFNIFLDIV
jgi:hypothetical protein